MLDLDIKLVNSISNCSQEVEVSSVLPSPPDDSALRVEGLKKLMRHNTKAFDECIARFSFEPEYFLPIDKRLDLESAQSAQHLTRHVLKIDQFSIQGGRPYQEDRCFVSRLSTGVLAGVLDGHGYPNGSLVSDKVKNIFSNTFEDALSKTSCILTAFKWSFKTAQEAIIKFLSAPEYREGNVGSTATISYVDFKTFLVYTANLGDSEAYLVRPTGAPEEGKSHHLLPLSIVRDWSSKRDYDRGREALRNQGLEDNWIEKDGSVNLKDLRYPSLTKGTNVSRAFGHLEFSRQGAISQKPRVTVQKLEAGDCVVLGTDGLFGQMPLYDMLTRFANPLEVCRSHLNDLKLLPIPEDYTRAADLGYYAYLAFCVKNKQKWTCATNYLNGFYSDNISAITIEVLSEEHLNSASTTVVPTTTTTTSLVDPSPTESVNHE